MNPCVYFVRPIGGGPIKIGFTECLDSRISTLLNWSPSPLEVMASMPGCKLQEYYLHERFAALRLHSEWFKPDYPLVACIEEIKQTGTCGGIPAQLSLHYSNKAISGNRTREVRERQLGVEIPDLAAALNVKPKNVRDWEKYTTACERVAARMIHFGQTRGIHIEPADFVYLASAEAA